MDINLFIGIIGLLLSIASFMYAIYVTKKGKREKSLTYEVMSPAPVADVIGKSQYSLRVVYERSNEQPIYIEHAVAQYVRFTNFGRVAIQRSDLAEKDKLRLKIKGGRVLDISLAATTREVCQIKIGKIDRDETITNAEIDFSFLDYLDGGLIQILTEDTKLAIDMKGTVIGMPEGIRRAKDIPVSTPLPNWGCGSAIVIAVISVLATPIIYFRVMGSWDKVWILAVPLVAISTPFVFLIGLLPILEPRREFTFPEKLMPPQWYHLRKELTTRYEYQETSTSSSKETTKISETSNKEKKK